MSAAVGDCGARRTVSTHVCCTGWARVAVAVAVAVAAEVCRFSGSAGRQEPAHTCDSDSHRHECAVCVRAKKGGLRRGAPSLAKAQWGPVDSTHINWLSPLPWLPLSAACRPPPPALAACRNRRVPVGLRKRQRCTRRGGWVVGPAGLALHWPLCTYVRPCLYHSSLWRPSALPIHMMHPVVLQLVLQLVLQPPAIYCCFESAAPV